MTVKRYRVIRTGRSARPASKFKVYYPGRDLYGLSADDTRAMGTEYVAISENESGEPFFTIPKEDLVEISPERIVCAAVRLRRNGLVIPGPRHWDPTMRELVAALAFSPFECEEADQGFIDQLGKFYTRDEAAKVAYEAGQIKAAKAELFSEDLY